MRFFRYFILLWAGSILAGCQDNEFAGFDAETWKSDRNACQGKRTAMKDDFEKIRQKVKGLDKVEVIDVLGRPDLQRLDDRNMTSYLYFLEPSTTCQTGGRADARVAIVRFNAVGLAFEVIYEQGTPL